MAIAFTHKAAAVSGAPTQSQVTSALTIPDNDLCLVSVATYDTSADPAHGIIEGTGIENLIEVGTGLIGSERRLTIWAAVGTGTSAAITIDFDNVTQEGAAYSIESVAGMSIARGSIGNAVHQATVKTATIPSGTAILTTALSALQTSSATFLAIGGDDGFSNAVNPASGWTEVADVRVTSPNILELEAEYIVAGEINPSAAISGVAGVPTYCSILLEILDPASDAPSGTVYPQTVWYNTNG